MMLPFSNKIKFEYKITIIYLIIGLLWIFFSDKLLDRIIQDDLLTKFQTFKGTFYIFATATLLFYLVRRHINNLKRAERQHKESEAQFRLMIDNAPEPIFIRTNKEFVYVNQATIKLYGATSAEQLLGTSILDRIHPDFHELVKQRIRNIDENKEVAATINYKHIKLDNTPIDVEVSAVPITFMNKNGALVFVRDITERNRIEHEIQQRTEELENFFNCAIELLCIADTQGHFIRLNKEWENVLGYSLADLEGRKFLDFVHPEDLNATISVVGQLANQIQVINFINRYRCKDGSYKWIEWKSHPVGNRIYAAARDITERLQKNLELIQAKEKAEESDSLKSAFLQNISHEVRTPLNAIVGFSQLITIPDQTPEKYNTYAQYIANSSAKLIDIITDVIEISQIHAQQIKTSLNEVEIVSFINQIVSDLSKKAEIKNIAFRVETDFPSNEYYIQSDSDKLRRIIAHLIDNAIKFTSIGGVEIKFKLSTENLIFTVEDTGIGISDDMQKTIFEPFRQVETKISRNFGGNGLGLTIVKAYTELLNGSIELHSEINKGTHITVTIPVIGSGQSILKETILRSHTVGTLLIAEDEYSNYQYLVALFEASKIKILYAENGQQAVNMCRTNEAIDLVLMDIKMPIMDGKTAAGQIKLIRPNLPIIAQTAYALDHEIEKYIGFDFDDYITKPIKAEDLRLKMLKYL